MIIPNGTIQWRILSGGGLDPETGYPVRETETWSDPVPCQAVPAKTDRTAAGNASGEHYTELSFKILVEEGSEVGTFLRLRDPSGKTVGEFPLIGAEPLDAVGQLRLIV